jgi:hypothetical protein
MKLQQWTDTLKDSATTTEDLMGAAEAVLVSIIGRVACWLTPLPSAVLVSRAAGRVFDLDGWWSTVIAVVLELVGLVTSNLWLTAKEWNATKRKSDPPANERLALMLVATYFVTAFLLLLAVELPVVIETGTWTGLTALLFPCLSAVGVIALNERVAHFRRVAEVDKKKRSARRSRIVQGNGHQGASERPMMVNMTGLDRANAARKISRQEALDALVAVFEQDPNTSYSQAGRAVGRSKSWVAGAVVDLEQAGRLRRNGDGIETLEGGDGLDGREHRS